MDVEKLNAPDRRTYERIVGLADGVVKAADSAKDPALKIPARTLSNVKYNQKKRIIEMGEGKNERQLFNLNQAKSYMQTMLGGQRVRKLIAQGKTTSLRGLFYMNKHTIEGTKEETFSDQEESDGVIEDLEVAISTLREELHLMPRTPGPWSVRSRW